jgi:hypothetical protein
MQQGENQPIWVRILGSSPSPMTFMKNSRFFGGHLLNLFFSSTQFVVFSCVASLSQIEIYFVFINFILTSEN